MTDRLRAVFDTNVFVSALLSRNLTSPTRELMERWHNDEFTLLVCDALVDQVIGKLTEHQVKPMVPYSHESLREQSRDDLVGSVLKLTRQVQQLQAEVTALKKPRAASRRATRRGRRRVIGSRTDQNEPWHS